MKYKLTEFEPEVVDEIQSTMFLTLIATQACNYSCEYCDVLQERSQTRFMTMEDARKTIEFIEYQEYKMPNIVIHFFGGEPTLNKNLGRIIREFDTALGHKRNVDFLITTNLARWDSIHIHDDLIYAASFHSDMVGSDYDTWFTRAQILWSNIQLHHIVLMLHEDNMEFIEKIYLEYRHEMPCIIAPITQIIGTKEYEDFKNGFIERHNENPFDDSEYEIFFDKEHRGNMHMCRSGFIIDEFGFLYTCWNQFHKDSKNNVFRNPYIHAPIWHPCRNYSSACDMEVPRSSLPYYIKHIKDNIPKPDGKEYNIIELRSHKPKRILFRCNG